MNTRDELKSAVLQLDQHPLHFERLALEVFNFQYETNPVYHAYVRNLNVKPLSVNRIEKIPFLPVEFFKTQKVISGPTNPQLVFESSGTTARTTSRHYVSDLPFYELLSQKIFENFYGPLTDYHIFALLPSYLERNNSSLVYMVRNFIYRSFSQESGFFLNNPEDLLRSIQETSEKSGPKRKILLIGVTFALLDLAENQHYASLLRNHSEDLIVMETGGMKGRRKELLREEVHEILTRAFGVEKIHSEYGMTELLSQGYSKGDGIFDLPASMKILLREVNDPFTYLPSFALGDENQNVKYRGKSGGINVIDLANIDSCSFIETKDLGSFSEDYKQFRIMGRFDNSDLRGCNLMVN